MWRGAKEVAGEREREERRGDEGIATSSFNACFHGCCSLLSAKNRPPTPSSAGEVAQNTDKKNKIKNKECKNKKSRENKEILEN